MTIITSRRRAWQNTWACGSTSFPTANSPRSNAARSAPTTAPTSTRPIIIKRIGHTLKPLEIVVVNTRAGSRYGEADFLDAGCGMGKAATLWLLERGVRLVGTDGWSWDAPFSFTRQRVQETGNVDLIWEGHRAGREIGYSHLEKLHNLELLPADGFEIVCFPVKVHRGSAGWTRAVAILP
jgi:kynurenine formamidase